MDKVKVSVPESWHDVSLRTYMEFVKLSQKYSESENQTLYLKDVVKLFYPEFSEEQINSLEPDQIKTLTETLTFLSTIPTNDKVEEIEIDGDVYVFEKEYDKLNMGEMVSFETILQSEKFDMVEAYPLILSILLNKKGEGFDSDLMYEKMELFKEVPITKVHGIIFFFLLGEKEYSVSLAVCLSRLANQMKMMKFKKNQMILETDGNGSA